MVQLIDLSQIIKIPYTTRPHMQPYGGEVISRFPSQWKLTEKIREVQKQGENLLFETNLCKEKRLVQKTAFALGFEAKSIIELGFLIEEEIAIVHKGKIEAIFFAFPSSWNPGDKQGISLTELHEPVADGDTLRKASPAIGKIICGKNKFKRHVWTITTSEKLSRHPSYETPKAQSIEDLWFRLENQYTMPIVEGETAAFFIDVQVVKLSKLFESEKNRKLIVDSVNSMSDAVLEYKNLSKIKEILNYER